MAEAVMFQKRNILILGRTGAGKRTMANQIVGSNVFEPISSSIGSATREATLVNRSVKDDERKLLYNITILDTYSTSTSEKRISQDVFHGYRSELEGLDGINLIIFALRKGIYEKKELQMFKSIINDLNTMNIGQSSALVITGCESLDDEERKQLEEEFRTENTTSYIATSMGKGIFPVGFPTLDKVKPALQEVYQEGIAADSQKLKDLTKRSGEVTVRLDNVLRKLKEADKSFLGFDYHKFTENMRANCEIL